MPAIAPCEDAWVTDGRNAAFTRLQVPADNAGDRAFVGQGQGGVELRRRTLRQFLGLRGAHKEGEVGTAVQFREGWDVVHTVYLYSYEPPR